MKLVKPADTRRTSPLYRASKVRGHLPPEYELGVFIQTLQGTHISWNASQPVSNWADVDCDKTGMVRAIRWSARHLEGEPQWRHLPWSLENLFLQDNNLSGAVNFEEFPRGLIILNLSGNKFTGAIQLQQLPPSMQKVYLMSNKFEGRVYFHDLPSGLEELFLGYNTKLTGSACLADFPVPLRLHSWIDTDITP